MFSVGRSMSSRLYLQAALTGVLAPVAGGTLWFGFTFAVAIGALIVATILHNDESRTRELVIAVESLALAVGLVGIVGHHYIPGTIVGLVTLIGVLDKRSENAPRIVLPPSVLPPSVMPYPVAPEPVTAVAPVPVIVPAQPTPVAIEPVPARAAAEILPGRRH